MWNVEPKPVQPEAAIRWFRSRLPLTDTSYKALEDTAKARGFTVSGLASLDLVQDVLRRLQTALEDGVPFEQWQRELPNGIKKAWGSDSGYRLKTIFDTNLQDAYGAGRYKAAIESKRPYLALETVLDGNTSIICLGFTGVVLPAEDPFWKTHRPPFHYRCRTTVISLDREQAKARGITSKLPTVKPLEGFGAAPDLETGFPKAFTPDQTKYHPELWAAYQKAVQSSVTDASSQALFGQPRRIQMRASNNLSITKNLLEQNAATLRKHLSLDRDLKLEDVLDVAGIPNGASDVAVFASTYRDGLEVLVTLQNQKGIQEMLRTIQITSDPMLYNESFTVLEENQGQGLGTRVLAHQIRKAQELGFNRIEAKAARSAIANGYHTWARIGFDTPLDEMRLQRIRRKYLDVNGEALPEVQTLQDVLELPNGTAVWREVGSTINMTFDLTKDSRSMRILERYLQEKQIKTSKTW
jgi:SPP1 gp7 family putative phage head morphogenesis protein